MIIIKQRQGLSSTYIVKHDSKKAVGHNITIPAQN